MSRKYQAWLNGSWTGIQQGCVKLWHMDVEDYAADNPVNVLTRKRLKKLNRIEHVEPVEVAE